MKSAARILGIALAFLGSQPIAQAQTDNLADNSVATPAPVPIDNFHSVVPGLYRGARPSAEGMNYLKQIGIRNVIDLQGGDIDDPILGAIFAKMEPGETPEWISYERATMKSLGIGFIDLPLSSWQDVTKKEKVSIKKALVMMNDEKNWPLFVHCEHGKDRTGLVVALYRVLYQHWTPEAAHDEMEALGHNGASMVLTHDMDEFFWQAVGRR